MEIVIFNYMRKIMFFLVVSVALTLSACGSGSTTNEVTDSSTVQVDSTSVPSVVDSVGTSVVEGGSSGEKPAEEVK